MKYCYKINRIYFLDYMKTLDKTTQKKVIKMHIDNLKINYIIVFIESLESDIEKLNLLLDILFTTESEKQIYIDRYTKNSKLDIEEKKKFLIDIKKHLFKEKEKLIISLEYDQEEKTLTKKVLN